MACRTFTLSSGDEAVLKVSKLRFDPANWITFRLGSELSALIASGERLVGRGAMSTRPARSSACIALESLITRARKAGIFGGPSQ